MRRRFKLPSRSTLLFVALAIVATARAWIVRHTPLEDLPFHLVPLRVVDSFREARFGFRDDFVWEKDS